MIITKISVSNFRNYGVLTLEPSPQLNILYGFNAQGKTNLLEAILYLATTRSHRTPKDQELVKWDTDFFKIEGNVARNSREIALQVVYQRAGQKTYSIGGLKKSRLPDYLGNFCVVFFSPEDLTIVKGSPKERRKFLDLEIAQISRNYAHYLLEYHKILNQRNNLLRLFRNKNLDQSQLDIWDEQLIKTGSQILFKRFAIVKKLAHLTRKNHEKISAGYEDLELKYLCSLQVRPDFSIKEIEVSFAEKLREVRKDEIHRGMTLLGPHRDDLTFYINGKDVKLYGSQGQQRSTALSLKLAELDIIYSETGEYPVLLLDDVLSELDNMRRHFLINTVENKVQTFITTTNLELISSELLREAKLYSVEKGNLNLQ